jgi:hypothetical protein
MRSFRENKRDVHPAMITPGNTREVGRIAAACVRRDRRASVALLVGMTAPVLVMALGLGVEVSRWSTAKVELQSIADGAAYAGAMNYMASGAAHTAALAAANLAWINGIPGTSTPTWTAATGTLVDNRITVTVATGPTEVTVTVRQALPLYLAAIFTTATSQTISATAVVQLTTTTSGSGPPACVVALQGLSNGVTTTNDIPLSNGTTVTTSNCATRSDASISITGGATVNGNVYAGGQISISNGGSIAKGDTGTANAGQIPDPFASDTAVQNALTSAASATGSAVNCTTGGVNCTISPGSYTGITVSNGDTLTLNPGLYTVNGAVNFAGGGLKVNPGGVTIVSTGAVTIANGVSVTGFSAATNSSATNGAIAGVLLATSASGSSAVQFAGGTNFAFTGLIYVPNGTFNVSNGVANNSSGCAEVVAADVTLAGGSTFASNCSSYSNGLSTIYSEDTTTTLAALLQ